jgi:hypothetical protein
MSWLSKLMNKTGSTRVVTSGGKQIHVHCSQRADAALAKRQYALLVEIELAFACVAHKQVRFPEMPVPAEAIPVDEHIALWVRSVIPAACETNSESNNAAVASVRRFLPGWIRLDYLNGKWTGEYGF